MLSDNDEGSPITPAQQTKRQRPTEQSDSALDSSYLTNTSITTEIRPPKEPLTFFQTCVLDKILVNERVLATIAVQQLKVLHLCKKVLKINPSDGKETIARLLPCSNFSQFDNWEKQLDGKYVSNFPSFYYHCCTIVKSLLYPC